MKYLAFATAILTVSVGSAAAQTPDSSHTRPAQAPVFRSSASLVALTVTVTDGTAFVRGLQQADFSVFEDGVQQDVQFFESANVPLDLVLLIDTSASMRDKMGVVHDAALGFLRTLRPGDRAAVIEFNDNVNIVQPLTSGKAALEAAVRRTEARGGTALNNALYIAIKQFGHGAGSGGEVRRQSIAVLSDGNDTVSMLSFDDVLAQARRSGVSVYTIALKSHHEQEDLDGRRSFSESDYAMKTLAAETGALSFFPTRIAELEQIYASIARELSSQYSIGYTPANGQPDGRFRRVVVRVTSQPGLKLRARSGYLAEVAKASVFRGGAR